MARIFLSYASENRDVVQRLADQLQDAGFSVWWDRHLHGGANFALEIEREIRAAKFVVVVWSKESYASGWVRDEAAYARDENKLVPVRIDQTLPPFGFRQLQTLDFTQWRGSADEPCLRSLVASLRRQPGEHSEEESLRPAREQLPVPAAGKGARWAALAAGLTVACLAAVFAWDRLSGTRIPELTLDEVEIRPFAARPAEADLSARAAAYTDAFRSRFSQMGIRTTSAGAGPVSAELVLIGEVTREGDKEMLSARIEDRATGGTLWSLRRPPTDGAAWEANLTGYALTCGLKRRDPKRGPDLLSRYLNACASFLDRDFQGFYAAARGAREAAPDDPAAIAYLAVATAGVAYLQAVSTAERDRQMQEARRLASDALHRNPRNADALFAMGMTFDNKQFAEQERWWRMSLDEDPRSGIVFGRYGNFLASVGRLREAMDMEMRAAQDRPSVLVARAARLFAAAGDWPQAEALYDMVRVYDPQRIGFNELQAYAMYGDLVKARQMLEQRGDLAGEGRQCLELLLQAREGRRYDAVQFGRACDGRADLANLYGAAGDIDSAYREVERILEQQGPSDKPNLFGPEMHAFRQDARFWPLAARLGFVRYWLETNRWPDFCSEPGAGVDCPTLAKAAASAGSG